MMFLHRRLAGDGIGIGNSKGMAPVHTSILVGFLPLSVSFSCPVSLPVPVPSTIGNHSLRRISIILLRRITPTRKRVECGLDGGWLGLHEMRISSRKAGQICPRLRLGLRLGLPLLSVLCMLGVVLIMIRLHDDGRQEQKRRGGWGVAYER